LYDALLDISDDRKAGKPRRDTDLTAYRAAHAATRHAMLKLRRLDFDEDKFIHAFDALRDTASRYAYDGDRDRSHPDLTEFRDERSAYNTVLFDYIVQPLPSETPEANAGTA
jgi:hypothetical protein